MAEGFYTIISTHESLFVEKASKFYSYIIPLHDVKNVKNIIEELKVKHAKSRHVCYAYRIGFDGNNYRSSDDGEPSGTAGKPILGQIDHYKLTNVIICVVRYFGGTLLGTSGLIKAYRKAASMCIPVAKLIEYYPTLRYEIICQISQGQTILNQLKLIHASILNINININPNSEKIILFEISTKYDKSFFATLRTIFSKGNLSSDDIYGCKIKLIET